MTTHGIIEVKQAGRVWEGGKAGGAREATVGGDTVGGAGRLTVVYLVTDIMVRAICLSLQSRLATSQYVAAQHIVCVSRDYRYGTVVLILQ